MKKLGSIFFKLIVYGSILLIVSKIIEFDMFKQSIKEDSLMVCSILPSSIMAKSAPISSRRFLLLSLRVVAMTDAPCNFARQLRGQSGAL